MAATPRVGSNVTPPAYSGDMATTSPLSAPAHGAMELLEAAGVLLLEAAERIADGGEDAAAGTSLAGFADRDVLAFAQRAASLSRFIDGLETQIAGEVGARSSGDGAGRAGEERMSAVFGAPNAVGLLEQATGASARALSARLRLGRRTRAAASLTGAELPAAFPRVAEALEHGALTAEAAQYVTGELAKVADRGLAPPHEIAVAEEELTAVALRGTIRDPLPHERAEGIADAALAPVTFGDLRIMVDTWVAALSRDGLEPDAAEAARMRQLHLGRERDGVVHLWGDLTPEAAAGFRRLWEASEGSPVAFRDEVRPADRPDGAEWAEGEIVPDERTAGQRRHDLFATIVQVAAASKSAPTLGGGAPTLLVTVDAAELAGGMAHIDGIGIPQPASLAHRMACTGAVQKVVFDRAGRIVALGTRDRLFNAHQRRAIAARDGGCVIPGCSAPAAWCEIHHVTEHATGGETHTDNGVLLCWWHHHNLDRSGWRIIMRRGVPHVAAPHWIDPTGRYRPVRTRVRPRQKPPPPAEAGVCRAPRAVSPSAASTGIGHRLGRAARPVRSEPVGTLLR